MRQLILSFLLVLIIGSPVLAQTSTQINFNSLKNRIEKSNDRIEHERRGQRHRTWLNRAELMLEVHDAMLLNASPGMHLNEVSLIIGQPKKQSVKEENEVQILKYEMERVNFYFIDDVLEYWKFTDMIIDSPLVKAYESFVKAQELDERGRASDNISQGMSRLKYSFISEGSNSYATRDYESAFFNFAKAVEVGEEPLVNYVDTVVIFYAALSAQVSGNLEKAIEYYNKSLEYDFASEGDIYYNIYEAYVNLEEDEKAVKFLEDGFLKYPQNQNVLYGLISHYLTRGEDPNIVLNYIFKAQEADPEDPSLFFAEGTLHDQLDNPAAAETAYKRAIKINPEFFDALYNLGALYFNNGVAYIEEANKVPAREVDKYDEIIEKSNAEFKKSIPYMEGAYKADPTHRGTIETLRNLYFRFRTESEEMSKKLEEINEVWSKLE